MRVLIYGAGQTGEQVLRNIRNQHEVIGFLDGNKEKWNQVIEGVSVMA